VTVCGILQLVALLPGGQNDGAQPDGQDHDYLDQVKADKAALVLPQPVVNAEPEHE